MHAELILITQQGRLHQVIKIRESGIIFANHSLG
jgi:hypothetical protein